MALSEKDEWLVRNAEIGYQNAAGLIEWWKAKTANGPLVTHTLKMMRDPSIDVPIFFDTMTVDGKDASVQGCSWKSRFSLAQLTDTSVPMATAIGKEFFRGARWKHPNGMPGGFDFIPLVYRSSDNGGDGAFDPETATTGDSAPALGDVGVKYDWMVCNAVVNDFFRNSPGPPMPTFMLKRMPIMASYVLVHKDYMTALDPPVKGAVASYCWGYSFLPVPVKKTIFGYGPGAFKSAFKQFRWTLYANSDVEIDLMFLVSPRSQKILDLGGFDPVYGTVRLINALTFNTGFAKRAHDKLDNVQMQVHARIYQSLIEGMKAYWIDRNWPVS